VRVSRDSVGEKRGGQRKGRRRKGKVGVLRRQERNSVGDVKRRTKNKKKKKAGVKGNMPTERRTKSWRPWRRTGGSKFKHPLDQKTRPAGDRKKGGEIFKNEVQRFGGTERDDTPREAATHEGSDLWLTDERKGRLQQS